MADEQPTESQLSAEDQHNNDSALNTDTFIAEQLLLHQSDHGDEHHFPDEHGEQERQQSEQEQQQRQNDDIASMLQEAASAAGISLDGHHDTDHHNENIQHVVNRFVMQTQVASESASDEPVDSIIGELAQQSHVDDQSHLGFNEHIKFGQAGAEQSGNLDQQPQAQEFQPDEQAETQDNNDKSDEQIVLSDELQQQVAALALELQQSGLENLTAEELQQHVMQRLLAGDFALGPEQEQDEQIEEHGAVDHLSQPPEESLMEQRIDDTNYSASETAQQHLEDVANTLEPIAATERHMRLQERSEADPHEQGLLEPHGDPSESITIDPALQDTSETASRLLEQPSTSEDAGTNEQPGAQQDLATADGEALSIEQLNEIIMGMDLSDPAAAIAQLQAATNIDPSTLLQAVSHALSSVLGGEDELYGQETEGDRAKRKQTRKKTVPSTPEERQKLKVLNRLRKKRWRQFNDERSAYTLF